MVASHARPSRNMQPSVGCKHLMFASSLICESIRVIDVAEVVSGSFRFALSQYHWVEWMATRLQMLRRDMFWKQHVSIWSRLLRSNASKVARSHVETQSLTSLELPTPPNHQRQNGDRLPKYLCTVAFRATSS